MLVSDYQTEGRVAAKRSAFTFPHVLGKRVLDVGCDFGYWSFLAAGKGADYVLGLDRNREVRGVGEVDLIALNTMRAADEGYTDVEFRHINLGKQWHEFGKFDVVLVLSMYHHWYECCGDHGAIWFWLSRHCTEQIVWEGPLDDADPVVRANVSDRRNYTRDAILDAAHRYFESEYLGPAKHEPTREVWRFRPKQRQRRVTNARLQKGTGGATAAFEYANGRRIAEIGAVLGVRPIAGSLNLDVDGPFDWDEGYYRAQVLDVVDRSKGFDSEWGPRWARFYPMDMSGMFVHAFRFEGEKYSSHFMEIIAPAMLRHAIDGPRVTICR